MNRRLMLKPGSNGHERGIVLNPPKGNRMLKKLFYLGTLGLLLLLAGAAQANLIIDSGNPPDAMYGLCVTTDQWPAAQFTISIDTTITAVQGMLSWGYGDASYLLSAAIFQDAGGNPPIPGGAELYSQTFNISDSAYSSWQGPAGLNWELAAGTYWLAFGVVTPYADLVANMPFNAAYPLSHVAVGTPWENCDYVSEYLKIGIRVYDNSLPPVPLPGAVWLLGSGLLGLLGWRRFSKV